MELSLLLDGTSCRILQEAPEKSDILGLCEDSRRIKPGWLFYCRKGNRTNGNMYMKQAVAKGAAAVISKSFSKDELEMLSKSHVCVIQADTDAGRQLQLTGKEKKSGPGMAVKAENAGSSQDKGLQAHLASNFYGFPQNKLSLTGVTGTKGKTTVCAMIQKILEDNGVLCAMAGTNGCTVRGKTAKSRHTTGELFELYAFLFEAVRAGCTHCVLEISSLAIKQGRIDGLEFDLGVFTNLYFDHIGEGEHSSFEEYAGWKQRFFDSCKTALLNDDDPFSAQIKAAICTEKPCFFYSVTEKEKQADSFVTDTGKNKEKGIRLTNSYGGIFGQSFWWHWRHEAPVFVSLNMPGDYNVSNAAAAVSACRILLDKKVFQANLGDFCVSGRFEIAGYFHGGIIIIDYAHNEESLKKLLMAVREYAPEHVICMFGCGGGRSKVRRRGMGRVSTLLSDFTVITQDNSRNEPFEAILEDILSGVVPGSRYAVISDRKAAIRYCMGKMRPKDILILAGKGHEDTQETGGKITRFCEKEIVEDIIKNACAAERGTAFD